MSDKSEIAVTLENGMRFSYECDAWKAREHVSAIVKTGYRSVRDGVLTHYPPHLISKVTATNQETQYTDKVSGT